jgi:N-formylglutamate amidohydrolase
LLPRAFLDVNREAYELDPRCSTAPARPSSTRFAARFDRPGTIPRIVGETSDLFGKLAFAKSTALRRHYTPITRAWNPWSATPAALRLCVLLGLPLHADADGGIGNRRTDVVLGDGFGASCDAQVPTRRARYVRTGLCGGAQPPLCGGDTTRHYGRPARGVHALQIEIARRLYMNEAELAPLPGLGRIAESLTILIEALGKLPLPNVGEPEIRAAD